MQRARRDPAHVAFTMRTIRWLDRTVAVPAYAVVLVSGLAMVSLGIARLTDRWLILALALYVVIAVLGGAVFGPVVRAQLAAFERGGVADPDYLRHERRANRLAWLTIAGTLVILFLMVFRPF